MDNDTGDRSNQLQNGENNDSRERKERVESGKFILVEKIHILRQLTLLHQKKRKRNSNVGEITNRHRHLSQLPAIQVSMRNHIVMGLKLSLKMKNLNGNYGQLRKQIF